MQNASSTMQHIGQSAVVGAVGAPVAVELLQQVALSPAALVLYATLLTSALQLAVAGVQKLTRKLRGEKENAR